MPVIERRLAIRGARFYGEGDQIMFVNQFDSSTRDGPREATKEDSLAHPEAWGRYTGELEDVQPFKPTITFETVEGVEPVEDAELRPNARKRATAKAAGAEG